MNLVKTPICSSEMRRVRLDVTSCLGELTFDAIFALFRDISVHVGPDVSLTDNAIRDLGTRMDRLMGADKNPGTKLSWNKWSNILAGNITVERNLSRAPLNFPKFQRMIRRSLLFHFLSNHILRNDTLREKG